MQRHYNSYALIWSRNIRLSRIFFLILSLIAFSTQAKAAIIINEIMYHPASNQDTDEYIELLNTGPDAVNLTGWEFDQGISFTFPAITIQSGAWLVIAADISSFATTYPGVSNVIGNWRGQLGNTSEIIRLQNTAGNTMDQVEYADEGDWARRVRGPLDYNHRGWTWSDAHDGGGKSLELINPAITNKHGQNWAASLNNGGSPGAANSVAASQSAPLILDVTLRPKLPHSSEATTVTARILSAPGVTPTAVTVMYRVDGYPSFTAAPMFNDGAHGDDLPADTTYGVLLPGQPNGTIVELYVTVTGSNSLSRTWPAPALDENGTPVQKTNLLYIVDDNVSTVDTPQYPICLIVMTEQERAELAYIGSHSAEAESGAEMNGAFLSMDDEGLKVRYQVGVRNRGHGSRNDPPNNFHVNFVTGFLWNDREELNFNSKHPYIQVLGSSFFKAAGLPVAINKAARLRINAQEMANNTDTPMYGIYGQLEEINGDFATNHFPNNDGGNVYKCMRVSGSGANLGYNGTNPDSYRSNYIKRSNTSEDDYSDLIALTYALSNNTPDETYTEEIGRVINISEWTRVLALNTLLSNGETTLANGDGDDYFLYRGNTDTRFQIVQHDLDSILGKGETPDSVNAGLFRMDTIASMNRFIKHPEFVSLYYAHLLNLTQTVLSPRQVNPMIDNVLGEFTPPSVIQDIKDFIVARNAFVLSQIPSELTVHSNLPFVGGYPKSGTPFAALHGTADAARSGSLTVQGMLVNWSPLDGTWQIGEDDPNNPTNPDGPKTLIARKSLWRYNDTGTDLGATWALPSFNDTAWASAPGKFGYGGDGEDTLISYGPSSGSKYITTYFRHTFQAEDLTTTYSALTLNLERDDGVVVYINGVEAFRDNMPTGTISYLTPAGTAMGGSDETTYFPHTIPLSALQVGANTIAVELHQSSGSSSDVGFDMELIAEKAPPPTPEEVTMIAQGATWAYLDNGTNQGTTWTTPFFNDSAWASGPARLGYGGDGEITELSYGPSSTNKYIASYFRRSFQVDTPSSYSQLTCSILRDDGAVVYLNGTEAFRTNMPLGTVGYLTLASGDSASESTFYTYTIPANLLVQGENVLSVEIHQSSADSSDIGFDLSLTGTIAADGTNEDPNGGALSGVPLLPGINKLLVQAFSGPDGTGTEVGRTTIDVWYDPGTSNEISGTITDLTLDAASSPWIINSDLIVPVGVTLTIEPGTTLFFDPSARCTVYGRLVAQGTDMARIRFTRTPGSSSQWQGIWFENTQQENLLAYTDFEYGAGDSQVVSVSYSKILIDHAEWSGSNTTMLEVAYATALISNSIFPTITSGEIIHGHGVPADGYLIFRGNTFGHASGYSDIMDFTGGQRPGPIIELYDNIFSGAGDDALDLDGTDAHIEGNIFYNFHQDSPRESTSNAIATGKDSGNAAEVVAVRNIFYDNDHAALLKEDSHLLAENNTFVGSTIATINFDEPARSGVVPGLGADLRGNIFFSNTPLFENQFSVAPEPNPVITINQSIVPAQFLGLGTGNIAADPLLADPANGDFSLLPGSPAIGTGPNGLDMGALVPAGASISGEPPILTNQTNALLTIAGPGIWNYKYAVNNGTYSAERPIATPITLTNLADGEYTIQVLGRNSAGRWQTSPTLSHTWVINPASAQNVRITELMYNPPVPTQAESDAGFTDKDDFEFIELANLSDRTADLTSVTLLKGISYTFGATMMKAGEHAVLVRDPDAFQSRYGTLPRILGEYSGKLANSGEIVNLSNAEGKPIVEFNYSDGRGWPIVCDGAGHSLVALPRAQDLASSETLSYGRNWRASAFIGGSPGQTDPNPIASPRINEFAAHTDLSDPAYPLYDSNDWIELFNPAATPVDLTDFYLSDNSDDLRKWQIPAGQSVLPGDFLSFDETTGFHSPLSSGFGLDKTGETIFLSYLPAVGRGAVVDAVKFKGQENGSTLGRYPNGADHWQMLAPTHDLSNTSPIEKIIISEIMYHPPLGIPWEYIRLHNPTNSVINLSNDTGTWRMDGGIQFTFPADTSLAPDAHLLLVGFDPTSTTVLTAFKEAYGLGDTPPILGPYVGQIDNKGERIAIERPQPPDTLGEPISWVIVDEVIYFDLIPFPSEADGSGKSLHRILANHSGNEPENWTAEAPSPDGTTSVERVTLVIEAQHGTVVKSPDQFAYALGSQITAIATPATGYLFSGWSGNVPNGAETTNPLIITLDASKNLTAHFEKISGFQPHPIMWILH